MSEGRKRILSPFTGRRKRKAWKTRETYMPLKRRWNLAETDRGSYYKEEWIDKFLDSKGAFYNSNESQWCESYNENNEQHQLPKGFANNCFKIVSLILPKTN